MYMSLSEDKTVNLSSQARDPDPTYMTLLSRKQKIPTASASATMLRLLCIRQERLKPLLTAAASIDRTRLPTTPQQQSKYQAK